MQHPDRVWFGDPHLVALGSHLQSRTGAKVELIDLDYERFLPSPDPGRVFSREFSVVGVSCYSSYDYLTAFYLGRDPVVGTFEGAIAGLSALGLYASGKSVAPNAVNTDGWLKRKS